MKGLARAPNLPSQVARTISDEILAGRFGVTAEQRRDLLEIIEDRYGRASTLITSQIPVSRWHDVVGEPTLADAILDRLVHNAHRIELEGDSLRKRKANRS
jgi:DNA replication protein DnaC